jgi:hypothetical protein
MLGSNSPGRTASGGARTRFASGLGSSVMLPAGPVSETFPGEIRSSRQSFSVWPSDSTTGLVPDTAKIAMRRSGPITTPVSLTSRSNELASSVEDGASGSRFLGLNSGSASFRISGAAGSVFAGGERASNEGLSLLRIRPAKTPHPARYKAGKRIIYLSTIRFVPEPDFIDANGTAAMFQRTKQLATSNDMVFATTGASVNLTAATGGESQGQPRCYRPRLFQRAGSAERDLDLLCSLDRGKCQWAADRPGSDQIARRLPGPGLRAAGRASVAPSAPNSPG